VSPPVPVFHTSSAPGTTRAAPGKIIASFVYYYIYILYV
jgi:hypothetical protein